MFIRACSEILGILYDLPDFQQHFIFSLDMLMRLIQPFFNTCFSNNHRLAKLGIKELLFCKPLCLFLYLLSAPAQPNQIDPGVRAVSYTHLTLPTN